MVLGWAAGRVHQMQAELVAVVHEMEKGRRLFETHSTDDGVAVVVVWQAAFLVCDILPVDFETTPVSNVCEQES